MLLLPFGVKFKNVMPIMAFICTCQTNPSRLCGIGGAGVAGKYCLPLHITLQQKKQYKMPKFTVKYFCF